MLQLPVHQSLPVVQYFELAFLFYTRYYQQASSLLFVTLFSTFASSYELFKKRQKLFWSVDRPRFTPLVQDGRVRCACVSPQQLFFGTLPSVATPSLGSSAGL